MTGTADTLGDFGNWMTVRDVAARLKVSAPTIYRLVRSGDLDAVNYGTGGDKSQFRISEASVLAFLASARVAKETA